MNNIQVLEPTNNLSPQEHGLVITGEPTEAEWEEMGTKLGRLDKATQWLIGDWYNNIPWGDKKVACERVGLNYATARQHAVIASKFEMFTRVNNCDFNTHKVAASLPTPEERKEVLDLAAAEGWSVKDMREEVKSRKPNPVPTKPRHSWQKIAEEAGVLIIGSGGNRQVVKQKLVDLTGNADITNKDHADDLRKACVELKLKESPEFKEKLKETVEEKEETINKLADTLSNARKKEFETFLDYTSQAIEEEFALEKAERIATAKEQVERELKEAKEAKAEAYEFKRKAKELFKRANAKMQTIDAYMTKDEFKLIRGCLHSDREQDPALKARMDKAIIIFNRLEEQVNDKLPIAVKRQRGWA